MNANEEISLYISVPVCSFRKGYAREYLETEPVPPPSTIYGFLLSLIGEEERKKYVGAELAYAVMKQPELSVVLRTAWRVKNKKLGPGVGANKRPDLQEILTNLELLIWLKEGELTKRVRQASVNPNKISRFGGLSLGESRDLINDIVWKPDLHQKQGQWIKADNNGDLPLPIWVDHVGSKKTIWKQFSLIIDKLDRPADADPRWIAIQNHI